MDMFYSALQYEGYHGLNIYNFNFEKLNNILEISKLIHNNPNYLYLGNTILNLDKMTIEEAKKEAKMFFCDYFNIHAINYVDEDTLDKTIKDLDDSTSPYAFYETINSLLTSIDPFDLPIEINKGCDIDSRIIKPLYIYPDSPSLNNRQVYFSKIKTGNIINQLTSVFLTHEVTHLQTESIIGYTDDILNREVLSIFVEKIMAYKMDNTGELLKTMERLRMIDLVKQYNKYLGNRQQLSEKELVEPLTYIKSTLIAQKLFDMYLLEKSESKRDKYIDDVQQVFDGRIKVEDVLQQRGITSNGCRDFQYLKRHI